MYPFSYWDEVRKRWVRARYLATMADIQTRYAKHRIEGPPEIRDSGPSGFVIR